MSNGTIILIIQAALLLLAVLHYAYGNPDDRHTYVAASLVVNALYLTKRN